MADKEKLTRAISVLIMVKEDYAGMAQTFLKYGMKNSMMEAQESAAMLQKVIDSLSR